MEQAIIVAVVVARLLLPLGIFLYPLPAILACLVLDAADQSIFQTVAPDADLSGYQSYDKALDIYYLTIAYISTLRNWTSQFAVSIARFLLFFRLVGVVLFEATQNRAILFVFANTFEYVFIFYEAVRVRWDPTRMSRRFLLGATAFIWIVIKLPQEWWIHIAQLDTTDVIQEVIFGVPAGTGWGETFAARPWVLLVAALVVVALGVLVWWLFANVLPAPDRRPTFKSDDEDLREVRPTRLMEVRVRMAMTLLDRDLVEKVVLVTLLSLIFGQLLGVTAAPVAFALGLGLVIVLNTAATEWLTRRGRHWTTAIGQFTTVLLLNIGIYALLVAGAAIFDIDLALDRAGFFLVMISLMVSLYDRYRPEYIARFAPDNDLIVSGLP
ncbi:MAG: hypothetical protein U0869_01600 [Chloroflexota bacterium]